MDNIILNETHKVVYCVERNVQSNTFYLESGKIVYLVGEQVCKRTKNREKQYSRKVTNKYLNIGSIKYDTYNKIIYL